MSSTISTLAATFVVSLFSLSGIYALKLNESVLHRVLFLIIGFSAGTIMGAVFFDLLPEAVELMEVELALLYVAVGFVAFFVLERFIYWYHGHGHREDIEELPALPGGANKKEFAYLNLLGDAIHNFIDGLVIGASFLVGSSVGVVTTAAVIFHELPQEMGDYGILIYGGFSSKRALTLNFVVALTAVAGGMIAILLAESVRTLGSFLIALAAGGFLYLGASELIPELQKEDSFKRSVVQFIVFLLGMALIGSLGVIFPE